MDPIRALLLGGNSYNPNKWTEVTIPELPIGGTSLPHQFGTLFYNQHGRGLRPREKVAFILPAGDWRGNHTITTAGIPAAWYLGSGWGSRFPEQMKIIMNGNQYGCGGVGMRVRTPTPYTKQYRFDINYSPDGGSIMYLANTETFINASKPLIIEGSGAFRCGGGGGAGSYYNTTVAQGGSGAGYPSKTYYNDNPDFWINLILSAGQGKQNIQVSNTQIFSGAGGGYGRYGTPGSITNPSGVGGNKDFGTDFGEPGVVFEIGSSSDPRFQTESGTLACFDWTNYTGEINNAPHLAWKSSWNAMRMFAMFGYKDPANMQKKYFQGQHLRTWVGEANV